jgi:hypothetical protein
LEEPHWPLIVGWVLLAEQETVAPPFFPEQFQYQGPLPETEVSVPEEHRLYAGADENVPPLDEPHWPLTGVQQHRAELTDVFWAEQEAVVPPSIPRQVQVQGPLPETEDAIPAEQRLSAEGENGSL